MNITITEISNILNSIISNQFMYLYFEKKVQLYDYNTYINLKNIDNINVYNWHINNIFINIKDYNINVQRLCHNISYNNDNYNKTINTTDIPFEYSYIYILLLNIFIRKKHNKANEIEKELNSYLDKTEILSYHFDLLAYATLFKIYTHIKNVNLKYDELINTYDTIEFIPTPQTGGGIINKFDNLIKLCRSNYYKLNIYKNIYNKYNNIFYIFQYYLIFKHKNDITFIKKYKDKLNIQNIKLLLENKDYITNILEYLKLKINSIKQNYELLLHEISDNHHTKIIDELKKTNYSDIDYIINQLNNQNIINILENDIKLYNFIHKNINKLSLLKIYYELIKYEKKTIIEITFKNKNNKESIDSSVDIQLYQIYVNTQDSSELTNNILTFENIIKKFYNKTQIIIILNNIQQFQTYIINVINKLNTYLIKINQNDLIIINNIDKIILKILIKIEKIYEQYKNINNAIDELPESIKYIIVCYNIIIKNEKILLTLINLVISFFNLIKYYNISNINVLPIIKLDLYNSNIILLKATDKLISLNENINNIIQNKYLHIENIIETTNNKNTIYDFIMEQIQYILSNISNINNILDNTKHTLINMKLKKYDDKFIDQIILYKDKYLNILEKQKEININLPEIKNIINPELDIFKLIINKIIKYAYDIVQYASKNILTTNISIDTDNNIISTKNTIIEKFKNIYENVFKYSDTLQSNILIFSDNILDNNLQNNIKYIFVNAKNDLYSKYLSRLYFILNYMKNELNTNLIYCSNNFINIINKNFIVLPIIDNTIKTVAAYIEFINNNDKLNNSDKLTLLNISFINNYTLNLANKCSITIEELYKIKNWKNLIRKNYLLIRNQFNNFHLIYYYICQLIPKLNGVNSEELILALNNWIILIQSKNIINISEDILINFDFVRSISTYIYDILNNNNILLYDIFNIEQKIYLLLNKEWHHEFLFLNSLKKIIYQLNKSLQIYNITQFDPLFPIDLINSILNNIDFNKKIIFNNSSVSIILNKIKLSSMPINITMDSTLNNIIHNLILLLNTGLETTITSKKDFQNIINNFIDTNLSLQNFINQYNKLELNNLIQINESMINIINITNLIIHKIESVPSKALKTVFNNSSLNNNSSAYAVSNTVEIEISKILDIVKNILTDIIPSKTNMDIILSKILNIPKLISDTIYQGSTIALKTCITEISKFQNDVSISKIYCIISTTSTIIKYFNDLKIFNYISEIIPNIAILNTYISEVKTHNYNIDILNAANDAILNANIAAPLIDNTVKSIVIATNTASNASIEAAKIASLYPEMINNSTMATIETTKAIEYTISIISKSYNLLKIPQSLDNNKCPFSKIQLLNVNEHNKDMTIHDIPRQDSNKIILSKIHFYKLEENIKFICIYLDKLNTNYMNMFIGDKIDFIDHTNIILDIIKLNNIIEIQVNEQLEYIQMLELNKDKLNHDQYQTIKLLYENTKYIYDVIIKFNLDLQLLDRLEYKNNIFKQSIKEFEDTYNNSINKIQTDIYLIESFIENPILTLESHIINIKNDLIELYKIQSSIQNIMIEATTNYNINIKIYNNEVIKYYNNIYNNIYENQNDIDLQNIINILETEYNKYNDGSTQLKLIEEKIINFKNRLQKYTIYINTFNNEYRYDILYDTLNKLELEIFMGQMATYIYNDSNLFKLLISIFYEGSQNNIQYLELIHKIETLIYINNPDKQQHINYNLSELYTDKFINYISKIFDINDQQILTEQKYKLTDYIKIILNDISLIHKNEQNNISQSGGSKESMCYFNDLDILTSINKNMLFSNNKSSKIINMLFNLNKRSSNNDKLNKKAYNKNKPILLKDDKINVIELPTPEENNIVEHNNIIQLGGDINEIENIGHYHLILNNYYTNVFQKSPNTSDDIGLPLPVHNNLHEFYIYTTIFLINKIYETDEARDFLIGKDPQYIAYLIEELIITQINMYIDHNITEVFKELNITHESTHESKLTDLELYATKEISNHIKFNIYEENTIKKDDDITNYLIFSNDLNNIMINNNIHILQFNLNIIKLLYNANTNFTITTFNGKITIYELIRNYNHQLIDFLLTKNYINDKIFNIYIKSFIKNELIDNINKLLKNVNTLDDLLNNIDNNLYNNVIILFKNDDLYYNNILKYIKESFHIVSYKIINKLFSFIDNKISILEQLEIELEKKPNYLLYNNYTYIITLYEKHFKLSNYIMKKLCIESESEPETESVPLVDIQDNFKDIPDLQINIDNKINNVIKLYDFLNKIIENIKKNPTEQIKKDLIELEKDFTKNIDIKLIKYYFTNFKNIIENNKSILKYIYDIINDVCKLLIGSSIENCMRDILTTYFNENIDAPPDTINSYINMILCNSMFHYTIDQNNNSEPSEPSESTEPLKTTVSLLEILYHSVCPRLVKSTLKIFSNEQEYGSYVNDSINEILTNYFQLLNNYDNIIPPHIINLFTENITSYFDIFTNKIITLWFINIENILRFIINTYKCLKCYMIIHNIKSETEST